MQREKKCTKCGVVKPLDGFHRKKGSVDGRNSHCKECERERNHRYYEENRGKVTERQRRYREENLEKKREYDRSYREENLEKKREYDRSYHEENRSTLNQGQKIRHAQYKRASNLLASKKGVPYSPEEDALILADNGMTVYQKAIELGRTRGSVATRKHHLRSREAVDV